jgi:hypothetical protein
MHHLSPLLIATLALSRLLAAEVQPDWQQSPEFPNERFVTETMDDGVRINVNAPVDKDGNVAKATRIILFANPNGNTLEHTLGCQAKPGLDWHYDGQHIAAQTRLLRELYPKEKIVLICAEAPKLSWPTFRKQPDANSKIARMLEIWRARFGDADTPVTLTGHSGGGSFDFGVIEGNDKIPGYIDRIAFLDSNYAFDAALHAKKFEDWLKGSDKRRLIVVCYDDREIMLDGKKVVGPTGGTFRATDRMHDALGKVFDLKDSEHDPFLETVGLDGRIHFYKHPNPNNKILHTVLVGEMNGLLHVQTLGTPEEERWGKFGGPRAYTKYVQSEPTPKPVQASPLQRAGEQPAPTSTKQLPTAPQSQLPPRPKGAIGGADFAKRIDKLDLKAREAAILQEITAGNFPDFLRTFKVVEFRGRLSKDGEEVTAKLEVAPDYLAIGSDTDFVRMPMTPQTAQTIADKFACVLPTRKMVNDIDAVAELRLAPQPMTQDREAVATFVDNNRLIEDQRAGRALGGLTTGVKKDIVLTPRIFEKPKRLAIYGWRQLNGEPIQPLTISHWNGYVDYSHGVRLVRDTGEIDGKPVKLADLLADPDRCTLISDEGPMTPPRYPEE